MICDSGPLVALLDGNDRRHADCMNIIDMRPPEPFLTTVACLTEAYYFLGKKGGAFGQDSLSKLIVDGELEVINLTIEDFGRIRELMHKYADLPMDFADATIVATAERLGIASVFTLDHDFRVYRPRGIDHFEVVP